MDDEMRQKIEHDNYVTYLKMYYNEVFKNVRLSYDKLSGNTTTISAYSRQVDLAVPAKINVLDSELNTTIYCRLIEKDHYYSTNMVKDIFFNYEGNAYRIQLESGKYVPSKYVSDCNVYMYDKEMSDGPTSIDKATCILEKNYEIELDKNTNIITEAIRRVKGKEIEDKPLNTDNDIYRKIVKLIRFAKTEEEAIELLEENLKLLLITDSAKTIIDNDLLEGPLVPPYVQERIDQEWEDLGKVLEKHNQKNIGTKPINSNTRDMDI